MTQRSIDAKRRAAVHGVRTLALYNAALRVREAAMHLRVAVDSDDEATAKELSHIARRLDRRRLAWMRREPR